MRQFFPAKPKGKLLDGTPYFQKSRKAKSGKLVVNRVGVPLHAPVSMRLQRESASDRWFKAIGFACEFQTGHRSFDKHISIACDHPQVLEHLTDSVPVQQAILEVLKAGYKRIHTDGEALWLETDAGKSS
jgi:hypothetical protein